MDLNPEFPESHSLRPISPPAGQRTGRCPEAPLHVKGQARPGQPWLLSSLPAAVHGAWVCAAMVMWLQACHGHYVTSHVGVRLREGPEWNSWVKV